jgi:hypothetical protein
MGLSFESEDDQSVPLILGCVAEYGLGCTFVLDISIRYFINTKYPFLEPLNEVYGMPNKILISTKHLPKPLFNHTQTITFTISRNVLS